jgi:hypothetical protein
LKDKEKSVKEACNSASSEVEDKQVQELRDRTPKVAQIFEAAGVHSKTETEKAERIISFAKSGMSYDEIEFLASTMAPNYRTTGARSVGVY